jgi:hypothetical protein
MMRAMLRIRYTDKVLQGILVAIGDQRIRVALKDAEDITEYRLVNQHWISEDCEVVTISAGDSETGLKFDEFPDMMPSGFDRPVAPLIM